MSRALNRSMDELSAVTRDDGALGHHRLATWIVAGYLVLFLIRPWEVLFPALADWRVERIYGLLMVGIVLLTGRRHAWNVRPWSVLFFAGCVGLSTLQAYQFELAWPAFYQYITVVVTYFLIRMVCYRLSDLLFLIVVYQAAMFAYVSKSLWEYYVHGRHWYAQSVSRLVGIELTYGEPNSLAMAIVLSMPCWWFLLRSRHEILSMASRTWQWALHILLYGYPLVAIIAVGLTNSRAGMVGLGAFVVGAIWWGASRANRSRQILLTLAMGGALLVVAPAEQWNRLRTLWRPDLGPSNARASADGRWEGFLAACEMLADRPWLGVGVGNFVAYRVVNIDGIGLVAHNLPGQILGETGLLGALGFTWIVVLVWSDTRWVRKVVAAETSETDEADELDGKLDLYKQLALACQLTILLGMLFGLSLHNGLRYNWLWIAAFAALNREFCWQAIDAVDTLPDEDEDEGDTKTVSESPFWGNQNKPAAELV